MRILTEASGSPTAAYLLHAVRDAGHEPVGSDICELTAAHCLADDFILLPSHNDQDLWKTMARLLKHHRIDLVIPSFDEMMLGWAEHQQTLALNGTQVIISPLETIRIFQDKWKTYRFFCANDIPTPETSLQQKHPLIKPRAGRGSKGVCIKDTPVNMSGMVSQQVVNGIELTIDALFNRDGHPVYIIPRQRLSIREGKSTQGKTIRHPAVVAHVERIAKAIKFIGPINFQCFVDGDNIQFIEVNPRIAGGMALGFAASDNWVGPMVENYIHGKPIFKKSVKYGLKMVRYYAECFIS